MQLAIRALISLKPIKIHNNQAAPPTPQPQPKPQSKRGDDDDFRQGRQLRVDTLRNYIEQTWKRRCAQTPTPALIPDTPSASASGFVEALPRRITMKTFKPTNERCAVIFASPDRCSMGSPATMLVGGAFMKFNKLILNYVPNCQTGQATKSSQKASQHQGCHWNSMQTEREREKRFVVPPRIINVSGMDCQTVRQTEWDSSGHMSCNGSRK